MNMGSFEREIKETVFVFRQIRIWISYIRIAWLFFK